MGRAEKRKAAFFDMDRTLLKVNTAEIYLGYMYSRGRIKKRQLPYYLFWYWVYKFSLMDITALSVNAAKVFKGSSEIELARYCNEWFYTKGIYKISPRGLRVVENYRLLGYELVILTASMEYIAKPLAQYLDINHVICTQLETEDSIFTGEVKQPFCIGEGKLYWAKQFVKAFNISLEDSVFFTDSYQDLPMLQAVGTPVAVNPDWRLYLYASRHNWIIEKW